MIFLRFPSKPKLRYNYKAKLYQHQRKLAKPVDGLNADPPERAETGKLGCDDKRAAEFFFGRGKSETITGRNASRP
jgi:hypothetical protein